MSNKILTYNNRILDYKSIDIPMKYSPIAWYDSKDINTINKDQLNFINSWLDKSGNNYHLTSSGDYRPIYIENDGIVFDGLDDYMNINFNNIYTDPTTIFIVHKQNNTSTLNMLLDSFSGTNHYIYYAPALYNGCFGMGDGITNDNRYAAGNDFINNRISTIIFNGVSNKFYLNNIEISKFMGNSLPINQLNGLTIGSLNTKVLPLNGVFKEIIVYNQNLSVPIITEVNTYLSTKYNVPLV